MKPPTRDAEGQVKPMRYLARFILLMLGVALTTLGLIYWQHQGFRLDGLWIVDNGYRPHPLHLVVIGIAMIPPTMWEIFVLDNRERSGNSD